jgi:hypothetical protein
MKFTGVPSESVVPLAREPRAYNLVVDDFRPGDGRGTAAEKVMLPGAVVITDLRRKGARSFDAHARRRQAAGAYS